MSTKARKERKRAGIKFEKAAKVGTPMLERFENAPKLRKKRDGSIVHEPTNSAKRRLAARGIGLETKDD